MISNGATIENKHRQVDNKLIITGNDKGHVGMQSGNILTTFRWNHIFTNRLFSNTTFSYSRYYQKNVLKNDRTRTYDASDLDPPQTVTAHEFYELQNNFGIVDWSGKIAFDYLPSPDHYVRFGLGAIYHTFNPGIVTIRDTTGKSDYGASKVYAWEYSAYIEDDIRLTERLKTNIGLHWSSFSVGDKFYSILQPRISARYLITPQLSAKVSYARMAQYVHLLSNSFGGFPLDLWVPTTETLRPQTANQIAFGIAHDFKEDYELSVEGYYKSLTDVLDYREGANFFNMESNWEQRILQGTGRNYGMEFYVQKKTGAFTGMAGYTLSWSDRHFDELNGGRRFPYKYDRRHDISIALIQRFERYNRRKNKPKIIELSGAWVFSSGHCATLPVGFFETRHPVYRERDTRMWYRYYDYGERNNYRMKPYHRLDLSISFIKQKKWGERRWVWSIYNAYNRFNPYHVDIEYRDDSYKIIQYSLFPIIPSLSYHLKF